jgi:hypothetical protein
MAFNAPQFVAPTSDERELLLRFLHRKREQVVESANGLTDEQARWTPDGRLLPIIGVINHLAHVEERWIDGRCLQMEFPVDEEEFVVGSDRSLADVITAYWHRAVRTERLVRGAPGLDVLCLGGRGQPPVPAHVLLGFEEPVDLRWSLLHLIEETAHHAGHADSTREMLDATTMS